MVLPNRFLNAYTVGCLLFSAFWLIACKYQRRSTIPVGFENNKARPKPSNPQQKRRYENYHRRITISDVQCKKMSKWDSFRICDGLPYTKTVCRKATKRDAKESTYVVPNVVHYVWFGKREMVYYHYLSVRSAAANQQPEKIIFYINEEPPQGHLWKRLVDEIPCLETQYMEMPETVFGHKMDWILHKTDVARNNILIKQGGIYLDSDVLVLRSLDPLRRYPFTMGRSTATTLSNGAMLSKPNSIFLQDMIDSYKGLTQGMIENHRTIISVQRPLQQWKTRPDLPIHVELTTMQRPNPWHDGRDCISHDSFNISDNYMLHIHPVKSAIKNPEIMNETVTTLRTTDTTYGAAARAALFGFQDLVFLKNETKVAKNRRPAKPIPPIGDI
ncbi:uncharacterized protein LOC100176393 [Ciona intestinalis]